MVCKCGCGKEIHISVPIAFSDEIKYCECGCKQQLQWKKKFKYNGWSKFISGHNNNLRKGKKIEDIYTDKNKLERLHKKPEGFGEQVRERQLGKTLAERYNSEEKANVVKQKIIIEIQK